ncbi:MAG: hypothetical protein K2I98_05675 [Prevotella sp.]|nr:hypothetical protein [Prevotella sp.]
MTNDKSQIPLSQQFVGDVRQIIETGRKQAYAATGNIALATYWNIGRRIVEEEQKGNSRAEYGTRLIAGLADNLKKEYGSSYNKRNLEHFRKFYLLFNNIEIVNEFVHNLTWTHIRRLLSVTDPVARQWYLTRATKDMWSTTTLDLYADRRRTSSRN